VHSQGADSLILDVRSNPGGLLDAAVRTVEAFIPEGKVIVSTKGRIKGQDMVFKSRNKNADTKTHIAVLVNEGSASAAEIVAGALQDYRRASLIGAKTFGKGTVQTLIPLQDGSALRLTTSKYFTPHGRSINDTGIEPDVPVPLRVAGKQAEHEAGIFETLKEEDVPEKEPNEVTEQGESPVQEEDAGEKTPAKGKDELVIDNQIERAIDLLKGLRVYLSGPSWE
jgi:carboxyl-terminal processing protease